MRRTDVRTRNDAIRSPGGGHHRATHAVEAPRAGPWSPGVTESNDAIANDSDDRPPVRTNMSPASGTWAQACTLPTWEPAWSDR